MLGVTVLQAAARRWPRASARDDLAAGCGGAAARAAGALVDGHGTATSTATATAPRRRSRRARAARRSRRPRSMSSASPSSPCSRSRRTTGTRPRRSSPARARRSTATRSPTTPAMALVFAVSALVRASPRPRRRRAERPGARRCGCRRELDRLPARRRGGGQPDRRRRRAAAERRRPGARAARRRRRRLLRRLPDARRDCTSWPPTWPPGSTRSRRRGDAPTAMTRGGAADPPAPPHPSLVPGDRRADLRVGEHGQDAGQRVYRKLGVSCRSDAVARARACGLLRRRLNLTRSPPSPPATASAELAPPAREQPVDRRPRR